MQISVITRVSVNFCKIQNQLLLLPLTLLVKTNQLLRSIIGSYRS